MHPPFSSSVPLLCSAKAIPFPPSHLGPRWPDFKVTTNESGIPMRLILCLFLMWILRNEWNIWPVHCSTNVGKANWVQVACDTSVFPTTQMFVVSVIR